MVKGLESRNKDARARTSKVPRLGHLEGNLEGIHNTRHAVKALGNLEQDKPISPKKNLNLRVLADEQLDKNRDKKTRCKEVPKEEPSSAKHVVPAQLRHLPRENLGGFTSDIPALETWNNWDKRKGKCQSPDSSHSRITSLLSTPGYSTTPTAFDNSIPNGVPKDFNLTVDDNQLHVFSPTAEIFADFAAFLEVVEKIAGREQGVVKVIVPGECLLERKFAVYSLRNPPRPREIVVPATCRDLKTYDTVLKAHKSSGRGAPVVYNVPKQLTDADIPADLFCSAIMEDEMKVEKKNKLSTPLVADVWKARELRGEYKEKKMLEGAKKVLQSHLCAVDADATEGVRATLRCKNPQLAAFHGNSLMKSQVKEAGIHTPLFHCSSRSDVAFGMHMIDFGAYLLNYLHLGAPKFWKVVRPSQHAELEQILHAVLDVPENVVKKPDRDAFCRPENPPNCDNFLKHQPLYLPEATIKKFKIECTEVVQYKGEMVIAFPYAYHQGYDTGANIAETIVYASDRWEIFLKEGLYQTCSQKCSAKKDSAFSPRS